jgi:general stress protein 26
MRIKVISVVAGLLSITQVTAAQQTQKAPPTRAEILAAARSIIAQARFSTFVTLGEKGEPRARIVDPFAPDSSFTVWVATNSVTRKVKEIRRDARVVLLWFEPGNPGYVSLTGRARLVSDVSEREKHWKEDWKGLYRDRNHGDDYLLIRVTPIHMEVVSYAKGMIGDPKTWRPVMLDFR